MTDGVFPDRLTQLRARWEADPSSRIFLQLAEEYRHLGRVQDALAVLEKGLKEHPGYLSALVAKGRCHIELGEGEAARGVLERVVKQDATQMVANKLLVRAYLETGDPVKARERLDLYTLLNDSDPEIEELRRRIHQLESPVQPEAPEVFETPETLETPERSSAMDADPFSLEPPQKQPPPLPPASQMSQMPQTPPVSQNIFDLDPPAPPRRGGNDIFELELAPPPPAARPPQPSREDDPFALEPAPAPRTAAAAAPLPEPEEEAGDALFPGLASRDSRRRYLDALGSEGLFAFEPPPAQAPVPIPVATPLPVPAPLPEPDPFSFEPPPPPVIDLASEPAPFSFAPSPAAPADEASWLDEAAAVSSFASGPVPVLPAEPYAPAPVEVETEVELQPTAEELWSDEAPAPAADAETELAVETATEIEPPPFDFAPEPPPFDEELPEPELEPEAESEPVATATLGELYLRQGYHAEAERIFREVVEREPGNAAASAGLERLAALGPRPAAPEVDARRLLVGYRPDAGLPVDAELRARKAFILNRYLERLRHGGQHDVS